MSFTSHFQSLYKHAIRVSSSFKNYLLSVISNGVKQAGTRLSRRHIKVSKVAEGLQKAKVLVNWGPFYNIFFEKSFTMPKKTKIWTIWDFSTSIQSQISMSHIAEKTQRWDPLFSPGIVCYAEKK